MRAQPVPPPPPMVPLDHRKQMVDQDNFPDEQDNAEAKYLAQKNHRTQKETRAQATNLIRSVESPHGVGVGAGDQNPAAQRRRQE